MDCQSQWIWLIHYIVLISSRCCANRREPMTFLQTTHFGHILWSSLSEVVGSPNGHQMSTSESKSTSGMASIADPASPETASWGVNMESVNMEHLIQDQRRTCGQHGRISGWNTNHTKGYNFILCKYLRVNVLFHDISYIFFTLIT